MKIFFYGRSSADFPGTRMDWWLQAPSELGYQWLLNDGCADYVQRSFGIDIPPANRYSRITEEDVKGGAVMVVIGGDGTFLDGVRQLGGLAMPIVGINLGRLGFLAQIMPVMVPQALADICAGRYTLERRTMLTVEGDFGDNSPEFPCALNEFTLHRHTADMIEVATYAGEKLLTIIRGDGVIASTPTGSTAYSLSAGGPILAPGCACFVYSGIAPHNFSIRPFVMPDTDPLTFEVRTRGREALASLDNMSYTVKDGARFTIKKSDFSVFLIQTQNISFYDTLRDRTMWGLDKRDAIGK